MTGEEATSSQHTRHGGFDNPSLVRLRIRQEQFVFLFTWLRILIVSFALREDLCRNLDVSQLLKKLQTFWELSRIKHLRLLKFLKTQLVLKLQLEMKKIAGLVI